MPPTLPVLPIPAATPGSLLDLLLRAPDRANRVDRVTHLERIPARAGRPTGWPSWVPPLLIDALASAGVDAPWEHQTQAAELARAGHSVVVATGTGSGKSLAYLLPALSAVLAGNGPRSSVLYLAPTKALAADQLRAVDGLGLTQVRAATYDGDTPAEERDWVRSYADVVLTNPDMLHRSVLPGHRRWSAFFRGLRYVVLDECHAYRGVFGSHVAQVLRRLRRVSASYGATPTFVLASATAADPAGSAQRLVGVPVTAVVDDASPRGPSEFALWEPAAEHGGIRRSVTAEAADLLVDLVRARARTLVFVRSRRGAETVARSARRALAETAPSLAGTVAAYRSGYLPEDRRQLEAALQSGALLGLASTNALELGIDIVGLDAVVLAGFPGTLASVWQQAGRAGRSDRPALAVFLARDDPLDTYLVHHPESVFGRPVEATVFDPANPHVLGPQLACAAAELPLRDDDVALFGGEGVAEVLADLVRRGLLRRRPDGWYWTRRERPVDSIDLRGAGGPPVRVVEAGTGRLLGSTDQATADTTVHTGAVYLHQGESYLVDDLDLAESVALVHRADPDYSTSARQVSQVRIIGSLRSKGGPALDLHYGTVEVSRQVTSFLRRRIGTGEIIGEEPLDLPVRELCTRAVWYTLGPALLCAAGLAPADLPGAAHAAEHAAIGLLPLFATCDRWDLGGVSAPRHPDTGLATVFVYDGYPGGAGFAERGYHCAKGWLTATRDAIVACGCEAGCPSCVQSPRCGNGNQPLDKAGAARLLSAVVERLGSSA